MNDRGIYCEIEFVKREIVHLRAKLTLLENDVNYLAKIKLI